MTMDGTRRCGECGYLLQGLGEEGRCPECGREYGVGEVVLWSAPMPWREWAVWARVLVVGLGLGYVVLVGGLMVSVGWRTMGPVLLGQLVSWTPAAVVVYWTTHHKWQVRITAEGYGRRMGAGRVRLWKWREGEEIRLTRVRAGRYQLEVKRGRMARVRVQVELGEEGVEGVCRKLEGVSGRRVVVEED